MTPPDPLDSYAAYTAPSRALLDEVDARTAARVAGAPRAARRWVPVAVAALAAAVVALAFLARPAPRIDRVIEDAGEAPLGDAVEARWDGRGRAVGTPRDLNVVWESGNLAIDVVPRQGVTLSVQTDEAEARVVGTRFDVSRDAEGTTVSVREGHVATRCTGGAERVLAAGERLECPPVTAAALLGRARSQERRGADPADVLATLDAVYGATEPVATEVTLLRAATLARAGRPAEALALADAALRLGGGHRRVELLRLATTLAIDAGGCAAATAYTSELASLGEPTPCTP